jgi:hypothetical protein
MGFKIPYDTGTYQSIFAVMQKTFIYSAKNILQIKIQNCTKEKKLHKNALGKKS